ncbi:MAG: GTPase Era [Clostridia bacterium]|nr:GTPase Era [Clostridia bacterium]
MKKNLFAALIGRPNVGKSTLLNTLLGEHISIVSPKPQTTRTRITGILTKEETQFVFLDTPGIHKPKDKLGSYMMKVADGAAADVDLVLLLVEAGDRVGAVEKELLRRFDGAHLPTVLIINKTDISNAREIGDTIARFAEYHTFDAVIPISAKNGENVNIILDEIDKFAMEGPWFFPDDIITDQPERVIASEIIREKLLNALGNEIPHGTAVVIESFKEKKDLISIRAEIFCEKNSHKPIIIGKNGEMLKKIGSWAREDMEKFFGVKIFLDLWVKVKENWRESAAVVANFGFKEE